MTRLGVGASCAGATLAVLGALARWAPVAELGAGLLVIVVVSVAYVLHRPRLQLRRVVEPGRVHKGQPALAVVEATNRGRRSAGPVAVEQRFAGDPVPGELPRLRPGETTRQAFPLPTDRRGTYQVGPVELPRSDAFGLCRMVPRFCEPGTVRVQPRLIALRALPTGASLNLEGPSSDSSPQGSVTFHRLREYAVGDDLRTVHWPSTAKLGRLVVRHHVDTAEPYSVVVLDLSEARYSGATFEEAIDVAASIAVALSAGRAPVHVRTTTGYSFGGPRWSDPAAVVDYLTDVRPAREGSLLAQLALLGGERGGTALVVVTGDLAPEEIPRLAALRRRFGRVIAVSIAPARSGGPSHPALTVVAAATADELAERWNRSVAR